MSVELLKKNYLIINNMVTIYQFNKPAIQVHSYEIAGITPHNNNLIRVALKGKEDEGILAYMVRFGD